MRPARLVLGILASLTALSAAPPAAAEWFADGYLGVAITQNDEIEVGSPFPRGASRTEDVTYASSVNPGVRVGRWFDQLPWLGFAVDLSYFRPDIDIHVIPIAALVMARLQLMRDDEFPAGRFQPYAAGGPAMFISHVDGSVGFFDVSDTTADVGADIRLGASFGLQDNIAAFAEYRFTHVSPGYDVDVFGGTVTGKTTFNTHHILLGVSFRF